MLAYGVRQLMKQRFLRADVVQNSSPANHLDAHHTNMIYTFHHEADRGMCVFGAAGKWHGATRRWLARSKFKKNPEKFWFHCKAVERVDQVAFGFGNGLSVRCWDCSVELCPGSVVPYVRSASGRLFLNNNNLLMDKVAVVLARSVSVGAGKFWGLRRIFARISPNLPEKLLGHCLCEHFLKQTLWDDLQKKVFLLFCKGWAPFFAKVFTNFAKIFTYFDRIETFGGAREPPTSTSEKDHFSSLNLKAGFWFVITSHFQDLESTKPPTRSGSASRGTLGTIDPD